MAGGRQLIAEALRSFVFSLSQGAAASASAPGGRGSRAGFAAGLAGAMQLKDRDEQRSMQMEEFKQKLRSGNMQEAMTMLQALQGSQAQEIQNPAPQAMPAQLPGYGDMESPAPPQQPPAGMQSTPLPLPPVNFPNGMQVRPQSAQQVGRAALEQARGAAGIQTASHIERLKAEAALRPASRDTSITPFEAWREQNKNAPISKWMELEALSKAPPTIPHRDIETPDGKKFIEYYDPANPDKVISSVPSGTASGEPLYPVIRGDSIVYLPRSQASGQSAPVTLFDAAGTPTTGGRAGVSRTPPVQPSAAELSALGFYDRTQNAVKTIDSLESDIVKMNWFDQQRLTRAPNELQTASGRRFNQAAEDFINATLRRESGAAIGASEFARFAKIYFPMPGDDIATLKQKKESRRVEIDSLKTQAARAYEDKYGSGKPASGAKPNSSLVDEILKAR